MANEHENMPGRLEPLTDWETDPQTITEISQNVASAMPDADPGNDAPIAPSQPVEETQYFTLIEAAPPVEQPLDGTQYFALPKEDLEQTQYFVPVENTPPAPQPMEQTQYYTPIEPVPPVEVSAPAEPQPAPTEPAKGRPSPKKGYGLFGIPHLVSTLVWLLLIVIIGVSLGRLLWICCADLMAFGKPDQEISVTITAEDVKTLPDGTKEVNIDAIAQKMGDAGLINSPALFKLFATITGKDQSIVPGTYTLNSYFDYNAMINGMSAYEKPRTIVKVLIPEGYNCAQLFALLEENGVCTVAELEACAANGDEELGEYWFLTTEIPWGEKYCLEGYLFPDTYEFYTNDDPANVLNKMLQNFDNRFTDKMKTDLAAIGVRYGLSLHEVLTIASMVEEEAVGATKASGEFEGYNIASVYYNRLANWSVPILGCDATVYYAMEDYFGQAGELTAAHLNTDSPYNTRKYAGLPPGPITNPGSYSIYAALAPSDTEYYYYVYDPEQKRHILSKTEAEHNQLVAELGY